MAKKKTSLKLWIAGARLRTLPLAIAPVAIGTGSAASFGFFNLTLALLALAVSLFLQIGVNYANDYSDGIRGTDAKRVGPLRLTGSGSSKPAAVRNAAFIFFALAAAAGLAIVFITQIWWLLAIGAAAILAAWFYTGGKSPYGYAGFGEIAVFVFFGPVATMGSAFIQLQNFDGNSLFGGIAAGSFAAAVLMVNNIRDREFDRIAGKRTLAVRVSPAWAKAIYLLQLWTPIPILVLFSLLYPLTFFGFASLFLILPATLIVLTARKPEELILALKLTSYAALGYALFLGWGLASI